MSTLKVSALQHPSSGTANITLNSDGTVENVAGMGKVLQVVSTTKTDTFSASVASGAGTAVTGLTASLTCSSASNKVLVVAEIYAASDRGQNNGIGLLLKRAGTSIGIGDAEGSRGRVTGAGDAAQTYAAAPITVVHLDSPATTSSTTYSVEVVNLSSSTGVIYVNRPQLDSDDAFIFRSASRLTLMEVTV